MMGNQPAKDLSYLDYSKDTAEGNTLQTTFKIQEIQKHEKIETREGNKSTFNEY